MSPGTVIGIISERKNLRGKLLKLTQSVNIKSKKYSGLLLLQPG
ncbi:hypothetical protein [Terribacillus sp. 7520-G]|nr:hypothetical protein [Terribacillus sp. 7520-G]